MSTVLQLPAVRTSGSGGLAVIGLACASGFVQPTQNGGFFIQPFRIPLCYDVTRPATLYITITRAAGAIDNVGVIAFQILKTTLRGLTINEFGAVAAVFTPPANWLAGEPIRLPIVNQTGVTFPSATFQQGDLVGLTISRMGAQANDTYIHAISIAWNCEIEFANRCPGLCC